MILVFFAYGIHAQETEKDSLDPEKTHFKRLRRFVNLHMSIDTDIDELVFSDDMTSNLEMSTNNSSRLVLGANYSFLGFQVAFAPQFFPGNNDDALRGTTDLTDIRLNLYMGRWIQKLNYNKTEGYFVENTVDFVPDFQEGIDPYLQLDDLQLTTYAGETTFIADPRLSVRAMETFREWQYRTAHSFLPTLAYEYISASFENVFDPNVQDGTRKEFSFDLKPGYGIKYVHNKHWFLAGILRPGVGVSFINEGDFDAQGIRTRDEQFINPIFDFETELGLGYNSERLFGGIRFAFDYRNYLNNNGAGGNQSFNTYNSYVALTVGYRFEAPKWLSKLFSKVDKNLIIEQSVVR